MRLVLGYGEDSLTLWGLTQNLDYILEKLDEKLEKPLIFYRPSFGRHGWIGEFDAIMITSRNAYLIESKWDKSVSPNGILELEEVQTKRHEILMWYVENYNGEKWSKFAKKNESEFRTRFEKKIPPEGSLLCENLQTVLSFLSGKKLRNILLFFHKGKIPEIKVDNFEILPIQYETFVGNYIVLEK
jgi:hypothetical protein